MSLSVIVLTSPGREDNLSACLRALAQQTQSAKHVLVIDDGSTGGRERVAEFEQDLPLVYDWRPHDYCMSRSYNRAVAQAQTEQLVFLSGDVLLNPQALAFYQEYFLALPATAIWGYFGSYKQSESLSCLVPERRVNLRDIRLWFTPNGDLSCRQDMVLHPQVYAWGGNWALPRSLFLKVGGFDEHFSGWGYEDVAFANRLVLADIPQAFAVDVWGEHQVHPDPEDAAIAARNRSQIGILARSRHEPGLLYHPERCHLAQLLRDDQG
jgi:GT2 family glycosyltransferase